MNAGQQFNLLAAVAVVERIIHDEDLRRLGRGQRLNLLPDHCRAQQVQELAPVGSRGVKKPVHSVFAELRTGFRCLEIPEQILAGKDQRKDKPHDNHRRNTELLGYVALLE